ncbi:MAG: 50S ribosomal protein L23 [Firmicutes bacterium]|jgi:large subunit ribosomal protein L23|nr:50S ribosomal protein L23 [Bacillota bacterium]
MRTARDIIVRPILTEKTMEGLESNKYTFIVDIRATKIEIRKAVEETFKVKVRNVNTSRMPGKTRRMGRSEGKTPEWKKAVITLEKGHEIPLFEGV